jgi:hypothetical protein
MSSADSTSRKSHFKPECRNQLHAALKPGFLPPWHDRALVTGMTTIVSAVVRDLMQGELYDCERGQIAQTRNDYRLAFPCS